MNLLDEAGILAGFPWTTPERLQESVNHEIPRMGA
jgi:hypothetical protein